jgi:hypothetical protein
MMRDNVTTHTCGPDGASPLQDIYGPAVTGIDFWNGQWWATNGEYATAISYCPFCGQKLHREEEIAARVTESDVGRRLR